MIADDGLNSEAEPKDRYKESTMPSFFKRQPNTLTNEEEVRYEIRRYAEDFVEPYDIHLEPHLKGSGRADIAIPKSRCVIEVKSPRIPCDPNHVGDGETQLEQLVRYVKKCQEIEGEDLFSQIEGNDLDRDWIGVLTNGEVWWAWRWHADTGERTSIMDIQGVPYSNLIGEQFKKFITRTISHSWIPENPLTAFEENRYQLNDVADAIRKDPSFITQRKIWEQLIRGSGIPVAKERKAKLYLDHVFLLAIARLVIATTQQAEIPTQRVLESGYAGWLGVSQASRNWLENLSQKVQSFNWKARRVDVLRNLYENLIEKNDRKLFGEYYTPDWLSGLIVEEVLDEKWLKESIKAVHEASNSVPGVGVLDPCCGSGSFLFAAAQKITDAIPGVLGGISESDKADIVLRLVVGIDIHPLAIEMAQATLFRAIQGHPTVEPQVFQGDSLLLERQWQVDDIIAHGDGDDATFEFPINSGNIFSIPYEIADRDDMTRRLRQLVESAKNRQSLPKAVIRNLQERHASTLKSAHESLTEIIKRHGNGIWTWFIRNQLAPHALHKRKINRIISNPPWLRYSEIQVKERKNEVQTKAEELGLWVGGKSATSFDIAALFVAETKNLYLPKSKSNRAAFVLNHAAVKAKSWVNFRNKNHDHGLLSLLEKHDDGSTLKARPFYGAEACVVGLTKSKDPNPKRLILKGDARISHDDDWQTVKSLVKQASAQQQPESKHSYYHNEPRQGSPIVPAVLLRIDPHNPNKTLQPTRAKEPWKSLKPFDLVDIPKSWRVEYLSTANLRAFGIEEPISKALIPNRGGGGVLLSNEQAKRKSKTWCTLDHEYQLKRGIGARTPTTLVGQINYNDKWISQYPLRTSVFYNGSGQVLRAAVGKYPIEHNLFRIVLPTDTECHYLCAMLNAKSLSLLFKMARESDRHFQLTPLRNVPVPQYNRRKKDHQVLSNLSQNLHGDNQNQDLLNEVSELAASIFKKENRDYSKFIKI